VPVTNAAVTEIVVPVDDADDEAEEQIRRQEMATIVRMLMVRHQITVSQLLERVPMMSSPALYRRLNAEKDWEAGELRKLGKLFRVPESTFFKSPDEVFPPSDPNRARTLEGSRSMYAGGRAVTYLPALRAA
jgi:hypothetical protein